MLDKLNLAIVDVETTGSSALCDRIIEVGIHRVERGRLAGTYSTLINPEQSIPPIITEITGISDKDVADAPSFSDVARPIHELLKGCVFVAHNVRFDYGFLRHEFERVQTAFSADCLCSVRLSRLLYPKYKRHSLSALIERFEFSCASRHRALDDSAVVWSFLQHVRSELAPGKVNKALRQLLDKPVLPPALDPKAIEALPAGPGAYVFYGKNGTPLYIGKSLEVRDRVLSHFSGLASSKKARLFQGAARIEAHPAFGELGAALLEARLIKTLGLVHRRPPQPKRKPASARPMKWPYPGPILIEEKHPVNNQGHAFIIDQWRLIQALRYDNGDATAWSLGVEGFDLEVYQVLEKYLPSHARQIRQLGKESAAWLQEAGVN